LFDARAKRRFEREAKAAAKWHHTNIVPVFDVVFVRPQCAARAELADERRRSALCGGFRLRWGGSRRRFWGKILATIASNG
jgi:hypothetical protein